MSKTKAGPIIADRLKSFIERIEKLIEERQALSGDIRDVFSEAKGVGYDVKTMRKLIQIRGMDAADRAESETLLDTYAHALGMETSSIPREPTEDELMDRAARIVEEADRCMDLIRDGNKPPKIEDIKERIGCSAGKAHKLRAMVEKRMAEFSRKQDADRENEKTDTKPEDGDDGITPCWAIANAIAEQERKAKEEARAKREARRAELAMMMAPPSAEELDALVTEHPAFLRRQVAA